jgi:hypothetical protein
MGTTDFVRRSLLSLVILSGCGSGGTSGKCVAGAATCLGTSLTFCDNGTERVIGCKGPLGCTGNKCDSSNHTLGDGCTGSGSQCDAVVGTRSLSCVSGQLRLFRTCSGPRQCYVDNGVTGCDVTIGDSCPAVYEARYFCDSVDPQQVVKCADGGVSLYSTCSGAKNCASGDGGLICQ